MNTPKVKIDWIRNGDQCYLRFTFSGHLTQDAALVAITEWHTRFVMELSSGEKSDLVFNCVAMSGYDTAARIAWQKAMSNYKDKIKDIWIISNNKIIIGAARTMGLLTRFNIKACSSEEKIYQDFLIKS